MDQDQLTEEVRGRVHSYAIFTPYMQLKLALRISIDMATMYPLLGLLGALLVLSRSNGLPTGREGGAGDPFPEAHMDAVSCVQLASSLVYNELPCTALAPSSAVTCTVGTHSRCS